MLATKEFLIAIKEARFYYALTARKLEIEEVIIPTVAAQLLKEYEDVTPEELPDGLPPKRDIQHHMDLIPGSALPNQAAYRLNPTQNAELNRQVTDLIKKGLVRESMIPCATPALLTPKKDGTMEDGDLHDSVNWAPQMPKKKKDRVAQILEKKVVTTRHKSYNRYLVRWEGFPHSDNTWVSESKL